MSEMKRFLVSYRHDGGQWNIELRARDYEDARQRLGKLVFAELEGEIVATIPGAFGPLAALAAMMRNLWWRASRAV